MNERIRELMEEAVRFRLDVDSKEYEAQVSPEDLEVFAELIVKECVTTLEQHHPFTKDPEAYLYAISLIEYHFGVE